MQTQTPFFNSKFKEASHFVQALGSFSAEQLCLST